MKEFKKFYHGEKGNSQSDLNILSMTAHTFPEDYAEIFWREALEWVRNLPLQKDGPSNLTCLIACINKELGDT